MVSSNRPEDYYFLRTNNWKVSETNAKYLSDFILHQRAKGITLSTVHTYISHLHSWMVAVNSDDFKTETQEDITREYFRRLDEIAAGNYSRNTLVLDILALSLFIDYLHGDGARKEYIKVKITQEKNNRSIDEYITLEQIKAMRDAALKSGDMRTAALIMMCLGTGARISEILDAKVSDLDIKQQSAILHVNGKTGKRAIPFVIGVPEITQWLLYHPMRNKDGKFSPDTPLFCTYETRGNRQKQLSRHRAETMFDKFAALAGVPDNIKHNPHAFRHRAASMLCKDMTIRELNMFFGWSDNSNTALTYMHSNTDELEKSILAINGIEVHENNEPMPSFVIQCPTCGKILPADAVWCDRCRMILDPVLAVQMAEIKGDMMDTENLRTYVDYRESE